MLEKQIFAFSVLCSVALAQVGDKCILKSTGDQGVCKISSDCPIIEEEAKRGIDPTLCGFYQLVVPIVCCPSDNLNLPQPDPLIFPEDVSDTRISEQKCEEYSTSLTGIVQAIPLVPYTEPINVTVEKCDYNSVPLILGGEPASAGEFPFMAAIGFNTDDQKWRCGGTLISERYILTAAHCTFTRDAGPPAVVRLGDLDLSTNKDNSEYKDYEVESIKMHPSYKYPQKYHDIALIKTKRQIKFTKFIRPACLYSKADISQKSATATGWGRTDFTAENSDILLKVTLNFYDNKKCARTYQDEKELPKGITSNMLCVGELKGGKDTCQGDSGGPLLITKIGNRCKFYVVGITSFGKSCGQIDTPSVYTKVADYVDWIERTIW